MSERPSTGALDAALDELYGAEPGEFVVLRKRLATELRANDRGAAKVVMAARRPTTAAWALNQLSRNEHDLVDALLERSRELQAAQGGNPLGNLDASRGDAREVMRDATRAQRTALGEALEAALAQLGTRANDAYRSQILATLHAASADESVADELRTGRLVREVSGPTGFPDGPNLTLVPDLAPASGSAPEPDRPARAPRAKARTANPDEEQATEAQATEAQATKQQAAEAKAAAAERRRLEREEAARARERAAMEQAQRRVRDAVAAAEAAADEAGVAEAAATAAHERVDQLERDLVEARRHARTADDDAGRARREATRTARVATKLRSTSPGRADDEGEVDPGT